MYIPEDKIDEVRAAADIVDVVGDYVRLKKRGGNYFGLCPFHNEKTPSFSVNPSMGIYKCFGCSAGGNVFQFVMGVERIGFPEAVRTLAERFGIPLPLPDVQDEGASAIESILHALRFAARFFYEQLTQTEEGRAGLAYLQGRGFTPRIIKQFGLGYAPDRWDALLQAAQVQHIPPEVLEQAGLVIPRKDGSGYYDRYRGRVIFPIFSHVGKVLGFGGRILGPAEDQPKYINSPETEVYNKSRVLYGLFQGKQAIRRAEEALLVEGYTDVISLRQAGVEHVVASSGTALTADQVKAIGRYAKCIVMLYDADTAGASAALRGIDLVLAQGLSVYAVALPAGEDPDSFVKAKGRDGFEEYVRRHRQDFAAFKFEAARRSGQLDAPEGQAEAMRSIIETIALIPDPLMQETYMRRASEVTGVPDLQLYRVLDELRHTQRRRTERRPVPAAPAPEAGNAADESQAAVDVAPAAPASADPLPEEKTLLRLMLEEGAAMVEFVLGNMGLDEFSEGAPREAVGCLLEMYEAGQVDKHRFLEGNLSPAVQQLAADVLMDRHEPSQNWERKQGITVPRLNEDPYEAATSAMTLLKLDRVDEAIKQQKALIYQAVQEGAELRPLQSAMIDLQELRKQIERRAFLNWNDA